MDCRKFESNIQSFIKNELPEEMYDSFIEHYNKCNECNEELEILYLVDRTITGIESDNYAFNLKEQLEMHMKEVERKVYGQYKRRFLMKSAITLAEIITGVITIVFTLIMFGIM